MGSRGGMGKSDVLEVFDWTGGGSVVGYLGCWGMDEG
jgi:hypothetical protein